METSSSPLSLNLSILDVKRINTLLTTSKCEELLQGTFLRIFFTLTLILSKCEQERKYFSRAKAEGM